MGTIIKEIKIPDDSYSFISDDGDVLKNLSKINIFVGENNSGKSRFLRSIIKKQDFEFKPFEEDLDKLNSFIDNLKEEMDNFYNHHNIEGTKYKNILDERLKSIENIKFIKPNEDPLIPIKDFESLIDSLNTENYSQAENYQRYAESQAELNDLEKTLEKTVFDEYGNEIGTEELLSNENITKLGEKLVSLLENCLNQLYKPLKDIKLEYDFTKIYIPILRGVRPLNYGESDEAPIKESFKKDVYGLRTKEDYFKKSDDLYICTGLETYDLILKFLNGKPWQRKVMKKLKEILAMFFNVDEVEIISNPDDNGVITVKIGDEIEKHIFDLGDGIQSIIIILLSLLRYKKSNNENALVFIEEPEHLLHPGFQRKLIEVLLSYEEFNNIQFFFTTHSNHFLDVTLDFAEDVSIFTLKKELDDTDIDEKEPKFLINDLSYGNTKALELLGVRNSSVFLSNCTIWVEGITDRYYIKNYLEVFQNNLKEKAKDKKIPFMEFKEDYHYSFVEYAGSNVTHWSFLEGLNKEEKIDVKRLCSNVFLIADKDNEDEKIERKRILRESLGENFCLLTCREIENLLTEKILLKVLKDFETKNKDEMDELDSENFKREKYMDEPMGKFIEDVILKDLTKHRKYKSDSGTLNSNIKLDFCKKSIDHINNINDFSDDAKSICNCIYRFIAKENDYNDISGYNELCGELDIPECNSDIGCQKVQDSTDE